MTDLQTSTQRRTLRTLSASQIIAGIGIAGAVPAGALLMYDVSGSEALSGLAQTFTVTGAALMAIPLARLTSQGGRRRTVLTGYGIGAVGAFLAVAGGALRFIPLILVGTLLAGAATAAAYQLRFAAVDLAAPDRRARDLAFVMWAATIGSVLGPNLLEWSGHNAEMLNLPPLVGPYLFSGAMMVTSAIVIAAFLRPDPYLLSIKLTGEEKPPPARNVRHAIALIRSSVNAQIALGAIVTGHIAMVSIMVMTPVHMSHVDVSLRAIGLVISVHVLGMYALAPLFGWLSDTWGRLRVIQVGVGTLLISAWVSATAAADDAVTLGFGLFLLGIGWSMTMVSGSALLADALPIEERPTVQGASDLFMNGAGALGGALAGAVLALAGYVAVCAVAVVPVLLLGIATRWYDRP